MADPEQHHIDALTTAESAHEPSGGARFTRQRPRRPPPFTKAQPLGRHYSCWYMVLLGKIHRLSTDTPEPLSSSRRTNLGLVKPCLDAWENALKDWLSKPWITEVNDAQFEAIYTVLYDLAEEVFELNASRKRGDTCQAAVKAAVRVPFDIPAQNTDS